MSLKKAFQMPVRDFFLQYIHECICGSADMDKLTPAIIAFRDLYHAA